MSAINVTIISKSEELPVLQSRNFFHSPELFKIVERTPGQSPYMAIAKQGDRIVGHMLVTLRRRGALIPPYLFTQARAYGEGEYASDVDKEQVFGLLLGAIERRMRRKLCLYTEFSDLGTKMFGYAQFRSYDFFPVRWMEIRNSLHGKKPEERLLPKALKHIGNATNAGLETTLTTADDGIHELVKMLRGYTTLKIRRYIPDVLMFSELQRSGHCDIFLTRDEGKVVGGCICVYSAGNCFLWYLTARNKLHLRRTYAMTLWTALQYEHSAGRQHLCFMDVGLPFSRNPLRELILSFGGKPIGTYRWFHCNIKWINSLLSWFWRE